MVSKKLFMLLISICITSTNCMVNKTNKSSFKTIVIEDIDGKQETFDFAQLSGFSSKIKNMATCTGECYCSLEVGTLQDLKTLLTMSEESPLAYTPLRLFALASLASYLEAEKIIPVLNKRLVELFVQKKLTREQMMQQKYSDRDHVNVIHREALLGYDFFGNIEDLEATFKELKISLDDYITRKRVTDLKEAIQFLKSLKGLSPRGLDKFLSLGDDNDIKLENLPCKLLDGVFSTKMYNIKKLSLWGDKLEKIPEEFGMFPQLEELDLGFNNLQEFPRCPTGTYPVLKKLTLSRNKITTIPKELFNLRKLEQLDLGGNNIQELPDCPKGVFLFLKELCLRRNKIKTIQQRFFYLPRLKILDLCDNEISSLPPQLNDRNNVLRILKLSGNNITFVPVEFQNFSSLERFCLSKNMISTFPWCSEGGYASLEYLDLDNNKLECIPSYIRLMTKLQVLRLNYNRLLFIAPEIKLLTQIKNLSINKKWHEYLKKLGF